jgi:hypothetical protein
MNIPLLGFADKCNVQPTDYLSKPLKPSTMPATQNIRRNTCCRQGSQKKKNLCCTSYVFTKLHTVSHVSFAVGLHSEHPSYIYKGMDVLVNSCNLFSTRRRVCFVCLYGFSTIPQHSHATGATLVISSGICSSSVCSTFHG